MSTLVVIRVAIPEELRDRIALYAQDHQITFAKAVEDLLGVAFATFLVGEWGGDR